ncbi:MAG: AMP-binding protein [Glaciimonas sp.]|nr:AMP-binding protein [Glaciimonas sp.]
MNSPNATLKTDATDNYAAIYQTFRWEVPTELNIAEVCCTRWARDSNSSQRIAVYFEDETGHTATLTYAALQEQANRLSNLLRRLGLQRGDCVAIILPQCPETAIAHIACHQLGATAMPLSSLFGPDALEYRLQDSAATVVIVDQAGAANLQQIRAACPHLKHVLALECDMPDALDWQQEMIQASADFASEITQATDAAILIYTSGTTGPAKGALIPHSAIIGNLSGFVASQNGFPQDNDVFWSPADWAWTGGLMDALLPTLYFGKPILGYRGRFSAETAFTLLEKYRITNTFLFPTALKMMMKEMPVPKQHYTLQLRAIMSAGEAVGEAVFEWCRSALGVTVNEMFGQTEVNYIVGNSYLQWPAKAGSMGRPYPGHQVAVIDDDGNPVGAGTIGEVALNRTDIHGDADPIFFVGYFKNPAATHSKYSGQWCRTGDLARMDGDGYLWYEGRADDMFKAAGYRIGPSEIENCLLKHPAVASVVVVPKPDRERGNIVKAFVVLTAGTSGDQHLIAELQNHVRGKLAPYEYPKEIEFIAQLPMTTTGKIQRRVLRMMEQERATKP